MIIRLLTSRQKQLPEVFYEKVVLVNFAKFTGKHLCQNLFFNKVAVLRPAGLLEKETLAQVFSCEFCEINKNNFFTEHFHATDFTTNVTFLYFLKTSENCKSFKGLKKFNIGSKWGKVYSNLEE